MAAREGCRVLQWMSYHLSSLFKGFQLVGAQREKRRVKK